MIVIIDYGMGNLRSVENSLKKLGVKYKISGEKKDIYEAGLERNAIIKQIGVINTDYEDISKATVIKNVYDWNKNVHSIKYYGKNPWTSWFWSQKYVDSLEYIDVEWLEND